MNNTFLNAAANESLNQLSIDSLQLFELTQTTLINSNISLSYESLDKTKKEVKLTSFAL